MQRILLSSLVMGGVVAAAIYGTTAFFSDTETSTGNTFTAGSVTIAIQNIVHTYLGGGPGAPDFDENENGFSFALADLKPLDNGTVTYDLANGANEAYVCAAVVETANADNAINDPEADAGDVTDGANNGELGDFLSFKFGAFSGTLSSISGQWQSLGVVAANAGQASSLEYCFGEYDGENCILDEAAPYNQAQTDSLNADVQFYAVQTRNNPDFDCSDLNPEPVVFQLTNQDGNHDDNQANNQPYVTWVINGDNIDFTFHNPTGIASPFPFEYRIDDEAGAPIGGITGVTIPSGPYSSGTWGDFYNFVNVGPGDSTTINLTGASKIQVRLVIGPERDYDFDWITFEAI